MTYVSAKFEAAKSTDGLGVDDFTRNYDLTFGIRFKATGKRCPLPYRPTIHHCKVFSYYICTYNGLG